MTAARIARVRCWARGHELVSFAVSPTAALLVCLRCGDTRRIPHSPLAAPTLLESAAARGVALVDEQTLADLQTAHAVEQALANRGGEP
ncbi:hypothetical protein [Jiangella rhizosphaerae]|uniref:Uncharacterized protein n=1 Tax=Jiangella rhizosphaerae TaxID=2293569 RepID=A0A418KPY0_9ACTN|nr:hypothetical protein [Jiangella rhizosphaerae]RIQ21265.1 hypothetical protein DY240_15700 [Jiangella rhizosphaerae]